MQGEGQDSSGMLGQGVGCEGHPCGVRVPRAPGSRGAAGEGRLWGGGWQGSPQQERGSLGQGSWWVKQG